MKPKKSHKKLIIALCIIGVIVVLIVIFLYQVNKKAQELLTAMTTQETAVAERRDLVSTVSASGTVVSMDSRTITSALTGVKIESVEVEVGDEVKAGETLVIFDSEDLADKLKAAENTQAQSNLKNGHDVSADQQALLDAQAEYNRQIPMLQAAVDRAKHDYEVAGIHLEEARTAYEADPSAQNRDALYSAETNANSAYASYVNALNEQESKTVSLQEAIDTAQYNLKMAGLISDGDTSASSVKTAEENLSDATVTSPISGIVTKVSVQEGDVYTNGALVTIEDCSSYEITAKIDEYDINKIKEGQEVVIKTNGTGDEELSGSVKKIAPRAASADSTTGTSATAAMTGSSGSEVSYQVTISIDSPSDELRLDMTAKLSIILEKAEDVLTVPYEAVQEDENGEFYVELVDDSMEPEDLDSDAVTIPGMRPTRRVSVKKGIESDYYTEVISDELTEGMEVIVPHDDNELNDLIIMMNQRGPMGGM